MASGPQHDPFDPVFCRALDAADRDSIEVRLRDQRAQRLGHQLSALQHPRIAAQLGERKEILDRLFLDLLALSDDEPERFAELVSHWALTFLLARLIEGVPDPERQTRVLDSLQGLLISQRLAARSQRREDFRTSPRLLDLLQDRAVTHSAPADATSIHWTFEGEGCVLSSDDGNRAQLSLPWTPGQAIEWRDLPRLRSWGVPCLDAMESLGLETFTPASDDPAYQPSDDWTPTPFDEGLEAAHGLLIELWPEVAQWTKALVPAFADMGGPPSRHVHRSGSYEAGTPIILSKIDDPFKHAEDLVHELQHERFHLLVDKGEVPCWNDARQRYVSPYRTDPRPLRGVLLGLHAFVPVNELRLRLAEREGLDTVRTRHMLKSHRFNLFAFRTLAEHETLEGASGRLIAELGGLLSEQHPRVEALIDDDQRAEVEERMQRHVASLADVPDIQNTDPRYSAWDETAALGAELASTIATEAPRGTEASTGVTR